MRTGKDGIELIKQFEGFSSSLYTDVAGKKTIGYGHLLKAQEQYIHISEVEAEELLKHDLLQAERAVERFISVILSQLQFDALVSFTFNLGAGALQRSSLRAKINRGEHGDVEEEWCKWVWAGGKRWPGLLKRRMAELNLFFSHAYNA